MKTIASLLVLIATALHVALLATNKIFALPQSDHTKTGSHVFSNQCAVCYQNAQEHPWYLIGSTSCSYANGVWHYATTVGDYDRVDCDAGCGGYKTFKHVCIAKDETGHYCPNGPDEDGHGFSAHTPANPTVGNPCTICGYPSSRNDEDDDDDASCPICGTALDTLFGVCTNPDCPSNQTADDDSTPSEVSICDANITTVYGSFYMSSLVSGLDLNDPVYTICDDAFKNTFTNQTSFAYVLADHVRTVGYRAFKNAFAGDTSLTVASFSSLTSIKGGEGNGSFDGAFRGCTALKKLNFGALGDVPDESFKDMLEDATCGFIDLHAATNIGANAFDTLRRCREVRLDSVASIDENSYLCSSGSLVTNVSLQGVASVPDFAFFVDGNTSTATFNVPVALYDTWTNAVGWRNVRDKIRCRKISSTALPSGELRELETNGDTTYVRLCLAADFVETFDVGKTYNATLRTTDGATISSESDLVRFYEQDENDRYYPVSYCDVVLTTTNELPRYVTVAVDFGFGNIATTEPIETRDTDE